MNPTNRPPGILDYASTMAPHAGLVVRIEACATTGFVVLVMGAVIGFAMGTLVPVDDYLRTLGLNAIIVNALTAAAVGMPIALWYIVGTVCHRATYGMRQRDICFCDVQGAEPSRQRCAIRAIAAILTIPVCPFSGILLLLTGRSLADYLCRVTVVAASKRATKLRQTGERISEQGQ